jgi:hypothetical protein
MRAEMASSRALVSTMRLTNSNSCLHSLVFLAMTWRDHDSIPLPRRLPLPPMGTTGWRLTSILPGRIEPNPTLDG